MYFYFHGMRTIIHLPAHFLLGWSTFIMKLIQPHNYNYYLNYSTIIDIIIFIDRCICLTCGKRLEMNIPIHSLYYYALLKCFN
jgi:hypothetical protein